jgi:isoamyl acetate esterase
MKAANPENGSGSTPHSPIPVRGKVSAKWSGISELMRSDSPMAKGLEDMLSQVDHQGLRSIASSLRNGRPCTLSDQYTCGAYNLVFEVVFDDGVSWIARLRSASQMQVVSQEFVFESPTYKQHVMESEVATMNYVRTHTTIPVPKVFAFDTTSSNPAKLPYILMECIHGWRTPPKLQDLPDTIVHKILDQLANVLLQLSTLQFPKIGYLHDDDEGQYRIDALLDRKGKRIGPLSTALEYYTWRAEQPLIRSNNSVIDLQDAKFHSYLYKLALPFLMNGFRPNGPFPLAHNDLGVHNMLFDENWKLVAVIDWTGACVVPWESFTQCPGGVMMGPYLRHEFSSHIYQYNRFKQHIFLECLNRHEQTAYPAPLQSQEHAIQGEYRGRDESVSLYKMLGTPIIEIAQCLEQYDLAFLRKKYMRKLCRLLFGPDIDVESLQKSISRSELFMDSLEEHKKGSEGKSSDSQGGLYMGSNNRKGSP